MIIDPSSKPVAGKRIRNFPNGKSLGNYSVQTPDGVVHPYLNNAEICSAFGWSEIADPVRPDEKYYDVRDTPDDLPPYVTGTLKSLAQVKAQKLADLAAYRYQHMTSGTMLNGTKLATDDYTQTKLTQAWAACQANPAYTTNWKSTTTDPVTNVTTTSFTLLGAAQIQSMALAVSTFVGKCYDNEAAHFAAINALTDPALVIAYDFTTGWPV